MPEKNTNLVLDTDIVQSLKGKGFNISQIVRDYLKELNEATDSIKKEGKNNAQI